MEDTITLSRQIMQRILRNNPINPTIISITDMSNYPILDN